MASFNAIVKMEREGELTLHSLPFHSGEQVQVTVEPASSESPGLDRFPLRGTPYRYDDPFEPAVSVEDWNAHR
jgi:hypothetical protein